MSGLAVVMATSVGMTDTVIVKSLSSPRQTVNQYIYQSDHCCCGRVGERRFSL